MWQNHTKGGKMTLKDDYYVEFLKSCDILSKHTKEAWKCWIAKGTKATTEAKICYFLSVLEGTECFSVLQLFTLLYCDSVKWLPSWSRTRTLPQRWTYFTQMKRILILIYIKGDFFLPHIPKRALTPWFRQLRQERMTQHNLRTL